MANHKSALKKIRVDRKRRTINKMNRSKMKSKIKELKKNVATGQVEEAQKILPQVITMIDKTVTKGTIHHRTGSRYKSRVSLLVGKASAEK